jgi:hypothetical protein
VTKRVMSELGFPRVNHGEMSPWCHHDSDNPMEYPRPPVYYYQGVFTHFPLIFCAENDMSDTTSFN